MIFSQTIFYRSPMFGTPKEELQTQLREIGWWRFVDKGLMSRYSEIEMVMHLDEMNGQGGTGEQMDELMRTAWYRKREGRLFPR